MTLIGNGSASAQAMNREQYLAALRAHDWTHEFSDDISQWNAGRVSLAALKSAQPVLDPDFSAWNEIAPPEYRVHPDLA